MVLNLRLKGDIVTDALSKMKISGITAPPEAEDNQLMIQRLEGVMYEFQRSGVCLDYNFTDDPDPADFHGLEFYAFQPVSSILAFRNLQDFAKNIDPALHLQAEVGLDILSAVSGASKLRQVQFSSRHPRGSGNTQRYIRWRRFYPEVFLTPLDCSTIELETDEIDDFTESYASYLEKNEELSNVLIEVTGGVELVSSTMTATRVDYRLRAGNPEQSNQSERLKITATTDTGRIDIRERAVEVIPQANYG